MLDFVDYSAAATGMKYYDNANTGGVTIDGMGPDTVTLGPLMWQLVAGDQGSVTYVAQFSTNISGFSATTIYEDNATATDQCSGSAAAYGASGIHIQDGTGTVPRTQSALGATNFLTATRVAYDDWPGLGVTDAQQRHDWVVTPLVTGTSPWP